LAAGTNHAFADSVFGVITAGTAEADSADSVEIIALGGDCEAGETDGVLSGGALDHNGNAGAVGGDLEERIVASETLSGGGVEGSALIGDVEAGIIQLPLPGFAGD
jgi:hypothetical protein